MMHPVLLTHGLPLMAALRRLSWPMTFLLIAIFSGLGLLLNLKMIGLIVDGLCLLLGWLGHLTRRLDHEQFSRLYELPRLRSLSARHVSLLIIHYYQRHHYNITAVPQTNPSTPYDAILVHNRQRIACQWRQYRTRRLTVQHVRHFMAHMSPLKLKRGVMITTGEVALAAEHLATSHGITIIDGERLLGLLNDYIANIGSQELRRSYRQQQLRRQRVQNSDHSLDHFLAPPRIKRTVTPEAQDTEPVTCVMP